MAYFRFLLIAGAVSVFAATADADGSWGGSAGGSSGGSAGGSSGGWGASAGSHGGGLLARLRARHSGGSSGESWGSSGGSTGGSSGASTGGSSGGSWGSSGGATVHHASYSSNGSSGGSSGESVGPIRRMIQRMHARHAHRGGSDGGSNGGSSGGSTGGSTGGSSGGYTSHGSSGGSTGGSSGGSSGGGYAYQYSSPVVHSVSLGSSAGYESSVVRTQIRQPSSRAVVANTTSTARYQAAKPVVEQAESGAAVLTVSVPDDAKVTVNGHPTTSDGAVRQFKSQGLKEGYVYTYVVEVTYRVDGEEKVESKAVKLRSGDVQNLDFAAPSTPSESTADKPEDKDVVTVVRLQVPANSRVSLAGNDTNGSGAVRTFRTKQLKPGQQWTGYTIRVTATVNGQAVSKERSIDVLAGSTNELAFDFDSVVVASR